MDFKDGSMPAASTGNKPEYDARTLAELERYGFDDPYDPRFIYRAVFGTGMRGRPQVWPDIQMDVLREVNPDVAGWIHMDGSPLDYPVVKQRFDRGYYLTHNFSGEESLHGQVALDFRHGGDMNGRTVVLHAHNMIDLSMFGVLIEMDGQAYFDAHPSVVIYDGDSYVECWWFAGIAYSSDDPWLERTSFSDDGDFESWLARVADENRLKPPVQPCVHDRVLVCSTCSMTPGLPNHYALLAVIGKG